MPALQGRGRRTRQLRNLVEPIAAAVFFVPEAHDASVRLGFPPPQGTEDGIPLCDWGAYFVSRAACMGQVHGAVVAAAFGVFEPAWVAHEIAQGWTRTDPTTMLSARQQSAVTALGRLLGGVPPGVDRAMAVLQRGLAAVSTAGKPVFAGLRALGWPGTPLGDLWRACKARVCDHAKEESMSEEAPAIVGIAALAIDCRDPRALADWWCRVLGGMVEVHPQGYATLHTPAGLALDFLPVPEPKSGKNRLHLDLRSRDLATATAQALALGATRADEIYAEGRWQVLRDPEGNEFCLLQPLT